MKRAMAPAGSGSTSAMLDSSSAIDSDLADAAANSRAMIETTSAIIRANTVDEVDPRRARYDPQGVWLDLCVVLDRRSDRTCPGLLVDSGRVDDEFQRLTRTARFREGEGLNGRAWRQRDLFFVEDLGQLRDCPRAPLASRAGIRTGIALPILNKGQVIGTMDFFALQSVEVSPTRLDALRTIGQLASDKIAKLGEQEELTRIRQMVENAPVNMMSADHGYEDPVHESRRPADAQEAAGALADAGRPDDRPVDRHVPQGSPITSGGCWAIRETCPGRRRSTLVRRSSSYRSAR